MTVVRLADFADSVPGAPLRDQILRLLILLALLGLLAAGIWWLVENAGEPRPRRKQIQIVTLVQPPPAAPPSLERPSTPARFAEPSQPARAALPEPVQPPPDPPPPVARATTAETAPVPQAAPGPPDPPVADEPAAAGVGALPESSGAGEPSGSGGLAGEGSGGGGGGGYSAARWDGSGLDNRKPDYPTVARARGYEGTVTLRVLVGPDGRAQEVQIQKSSGWSVLDRASVEAVKGWRFTPAREDGRAVPSWLVIPVVFSLYS